MAEHLCYEDEVKSIVRIAKLKRSTIAQALGPVFGGYALFAGYVDPWWRSLIIVISLGIVTVLVVVALDLRNRRKLPDTTWIVPPECANAFTRERNTALERNAHFWWESLGEPQWMEHLLVLWCKDVGIQSDKIILEIENCSLRAQLPAELVIPLAKDPIRDEAPRKGSLLVADGLLSDEQSRIKFARHDWALAQCVEMHTEEVVAKIPHLSYFGMVDGFVNPGITALHCVLESSDGWVLFCLRRPEAGFHPLTWSVTFEEQLDFLDDNDHEPDALVGDVVRRGLLEEFGIATNEIATQSCLAIGVERVLETTANAPARLINSGAIVALAQTTLSRAKLFERLSDRARARDHEEHIAWMAVKFESATDVHALLKVLPYGSAELSCNQMREHNDLAIAVQYHPMSQPTSGEGFAWHPTSRQRLYLWSRWKFSV